MPRLPFNVLQELDLPLTEMLSCKISYVSDAFLTFPYEARDVLPRGKRDLVAIVSKSNRGEALRQLGEYEGRIVAVFAAGDASVRPTYLRGRPGLPPNVVAAFATNNAMADRRVLSVPLGVRVNKLRSLQFVRQNSRKKERGLLYCNFAYKGEHYPPDKAGVPHVRQRLVEQMQGQSWATLDVASEHRSTDEELIRYYAQTAAHKFALSPEGHGVDCYRTWEALYLGAIPVVMVSTETSAFADLPILSPRTTASCLSPISKNAGGRCLAGNTRSSGCSAPTTRTAFWTRSRSWTTRASSAGRWKARPPTGSFVR